MQAQNALTGFSPGLELGLICSTRFLGCLDPLLWRRCAASPGQALVLVDCTTHKFAGQPGWCAWACAAEIITHFVGL